MLGCLLILSKPYFSQVERLCNRNDWKATKHVLDHLLEVCHPSYPFGMRMQMLKASFMALSFSFSSSLRLPHIIQLHTMVAMNTLVGLKVWDC